LLIVVFCSFCFQLGFLLGEAWLNWNWCPIIWANARPTRIRINNLTLYRLIILSPTHRLCNNEIEGFGIIVSMIISQTEYSLSFYSSFAHPFLYLRAMTLREPENDLVNWTTERKRQDWIERKTTTVQLIIANKEEWAKRKTPFTGNRERERERASEW
jgi:hypothetical protein